MARPPTSRFAQADMEDAYEGRGLREGLGIGGLVGIHIRWKVSPTSLISAPRSCRPRQAKRLLWRNSPV